MARLIAVVHRVVGAYRAERQWWRDARAARREYETLGCRSNAEIDAMPSPRRASA